MLPNRFHIVLSGDKEFKVDNENVKIIYTPAELEQYIKDENENFIIGGGSIYKMMLPYCSKLYITEVEKDFEADTFFPECTAHRDFLALPLA